jgi:hypothetical protein
MDIEFYEINGIEPPSPIQDVSKIKVYSKKSDAETLNTTPSISFNDLIIQKKSSIPKSYYQNIYSNVDKSFEKMWERIDKRSVV